MGARSAFLAACLATLSAAGRSASPAPAPGGLEAVRHVVVFIQENRSFDHYFGCLAGVRGFADAVARGLDRQPDGTGWLRPFPAGTPCLEDPPHDRASGLQARHGGAWDRWIAAKGSTAMAYHNRAELAWHYALADAYTVCDAYFASVLGPTNPNRLYAFTGTLDPGGTGGGPVLNNAEPAAGFAWTTYPERLQAAGVTWKVYQEADTFDDNPLAWFAAYQAARPGEPLYDRGLARVPDLAAALAEDVRTGALPRVAWVIAPADASEHPPHSPANGARLTRALLAALWTDPAVARSTVFLLTYDEDGGFFDHVPPPAPPPGTPDEWVAGQPIGLGVRVPMVIVSPWTRGGRVCSRVFDHTSILRFLERWTRVPEPNLSAWRRATCGDLTEAFDFAHPDGTRPELPEPEPVACPTGNRPSVPEFQGPPAQEPGTRSRVPGLGPGTPHRTR